LTNALNWTFVAPSLPRAAGGLIAMFEVASALSQQPGQTVTVVHVPTPEVRLRDRSDIGWFEFPAEVEHRFAPAVDPHALPPADVVVVTAMLLAVAGSEHGGAGERMVEALRSPTAEVGAPILFVQGLGVFPPELEAVALRLPGPKVCVSRSLCDEVVRRGVAPSAAIHVPNGVDHDVFTVTEPISERRPRVATIYDPHPVKGGDEGLDALDRLHESDATPSIVFGTRRPARGLPAGASFLDSPTQRTLARDVYNASSIYLQPSRQEGFGMCAVESMACGCALVTTDNGGSAEYAIDGETALVCGHDPSEMADALARLARDDALRVRLARNGAGYVERFRWTTSALRFIEVADSALRSAG
jgi:glycosyltransferase involved in cell wall biosynthesis